MKQVMDVGTSLLRHGSARRLVGVIGQCGDLSLCEASLWDS